MKAPTSSAPPDAVGDALTPAVPADAAATALRSLCYDLVARFGLEHHLAEAEPTPLVELIGDLETRNLRLTAAPRADDGGRLWVFHLEPDEELQPIAEAGSPDLVALVMRARKARA